MKLEGGDCRCSSMVQMGKGFCDDNLARVAGS